MYPDLPAWRPVGILTGRIRPLAFAIPRRPFPCRALAMTSGPATQTGRQGLVPRPGNDRPDRVAAGGPDRICGAAATRSTTCCMSRPAPWCSWFPLSRRPPTERYPYGLERAEDLAGIGIAVVIWASAAFAGYESIRSYPARPYHDLAAGMAGAVIRILGNQIVAVQTRRRQAHSLGHADRRRPALLA